MPWWFAVGSENSACNATQYLLGEVAEYYNPYWPIFMMFYGSGKGMMGETRTGFAAKTTIKRSEFGVDKYVPSIGDDVALEIEVEFTKK